MLKKNQHVIAKCALPIGKINCFGTLPVVIFPLPQVVRTSKFKTHILHFKCFFFPYVKIYT